MRPCFFLDRDGIVNRSPGEEYVLDWRDFHLEPEFVAVLRLATARGWPAVIVTNQRCVALGLLSRERLDDMHARLRRQLLADHGLDVLDIAVCPHDRDCTACRKPAPGLLIDAARRHDLDLARSWMIGDQPRDIEAGRRAGCRTVLVSAHPALVPPPDLHVPTLKAFREALESGWPDGYNSRRQAIGEHQQ